MSSGQGGGGTAATRTTAGSDDAVLYEGDLWVQEAVMTKVFKLKVGNPHEPTDVCCCSRRQVIAAFNQSAANRFDDVSSVA